MINEVSAKVLGDIRFFFFLGDVTKIEVVLEEAPDAINVGSMSSQLEPTSELNSTLPNGEANNTFIYFERT